MKEIEVQKKKQPNDLVHRFVQYCRIELVFLSDIVSAGLLPLPGGAPLFHLLAFLPRFRCIMQIARYIVCYLFNECKSIRQTISNQFFKISPPILSDGLSSSIYRRRRDIHLQCTFANEIRCWNIDVWKYICIDNKLTNK